MNRCFQDHCGGLLVKSVAGAIVVTGTAIGYAGFWGTAVAHASTHQETLQLTCTAPNGGSQSGSGTLSWDFPDAVTVGQSTPPDHITMTAQSQSSNVGEAYSFYDVRSVSENGDASVTVSAPQGDIPFTLPYSDAAQVPASGSITTVSHFTLPSFPVTRPGVAKFTIGKITLNMTPRDANGNVVPPGTVSGTCTADPAVVGSFQINPAPQNTQSPGPTTTATGPTSPSHPSPKPTSPSPSSVDTSPVILPPSPVPTPTPTPSPTTNLLARLTGNDMAILGSSAVACVVIGALVAALVLGRLRR